MVQRAVFAALATSTLAITAACDSGGATDATPTAPPASHGPLRDGSYSAIGEYVNPAGRSKVKVDIVLNSGVVTALSVTPEAENATSRQFQQKFVSGVDALVVGKRIDSLHVDKVAGSSLTQKGFEQAVAEIIADASA